MMHDSPSPRYAMRGLLLQAAILLCAGALPFVPPARGAMLLVPLLPGSGEAAAWAPQVGARLVRPGPFPGSYLVWADGPGLPNAALAHGALPLNAGLAGCSTTDKRSQ